MLKNLFNKLLFNKVKTKKCNFCDCIEHGGNPFIVGSNSSICSNCVLSAYAILFGDVKPSFGQEGWYDDIDFLDAIRKKEIEGES